MAGEIALDFRVGQTVYTQLRNRTSGYVWNGSTFEAYSSNSGNIATYPISLTEQGQSAHYVGNAPATLPAGSYDVTAKQKLNAFFAESDPNVGNGTLEWNGGTIPALSDLVTSGQLGQISPLRLARGVMVRNFPVYLKSSQDHVTPLVSGVLSGQISRDGGAFGSLQSGSFAEVGLGFYRVDLTSGDLLANAVSLLFSANGVSGGQADPLPLSFIMQRSSGQI